MNDFEITCDAGAISTIYLVKPITEEAREFADIEFENVQMWGGGYAVSHSQIDDVMYDLVTSQGFAVEFNGRNVWRAA